MALLYSSFDRKTEIALFKGCFTRVKKGYQVKNITNPFPVIKFEKKTRIVNRISAITKETVIPITQFDPINSFRSTAFLQPERNRIKGGRISPFLSISITAIDVT